MYLELPILAFASGYNEETTHHKALYFKNEEELKKLILDIDEENFQKMKEELKAIANQHYCWDIIANEYKKQFYKIINKKYD
jgi:glycosyltransferase involved in cell wall biosynthesis